MGVLLGRLCDLLLLVLLYLIDAGLSKKVSKWGKLLSVLLLLTIMLPMAFSASAIGNVTDTAFVLERTGVAKSQVSTPMRGKLDYTSSYAYNVSSNVDFTKVEVRGANSDASPAIYGTQCTYGAYKRLNRGTSSYFPNTVKESGYSFAGFVFNFTYVDAYINVLWSPDSV